MIGEILRGVLDTENYRAKHSFDGLERGQQPELYTLFCGDSRVEAAAVTDDPLNKLFGNEVIGNQVLGITGSAAYPTEHLPSVRLVNVMGHVSCGAVAAAHNLSRNLAPNLPSGAKDLIKVIEGTIRHLLAAQRPLIILEAEKAIAAELAPMAQFFANARSIIGNDAAPYYVKYATANVLLQTSILMCMPHIKEKVNKGEMLVTGTIYDFVGILGEKGMIYLVDVNGTGGVGDVPQRTASYRSNMRPALELLKA